MTYQGGTGSRRSISHSVRPLHNMSTRRKTYPEVRLVSELVDEAANAKSVRPLGGGGGGDSVQSLETRWRDGSSARGRDSIRRHVDLGDWPVSGRGNEAEDVAGERLGEAASRRSEVVHMNTNMLKTYTVVG